MDTEKAFGAVQAHIKDGAYDKVTPIVKNIADSSDDIFVLLKCASVLKVTEDEDTCQDILDTVIEKASGAADKLTVAASLRRMGRAADALRLTEDMEEDDSVLYEKAAALHSLEKNGDALSAIGKIKAMPHEQKILMTQILCSLGKLKEAHETASQLMNEHRSYDSYVNMCNVLMFSGKNKDAIRTAKDLLKNGKNDADALALNAYVMRINGRIPAAAAFAHRALTANNEHTGALETLAYCLIEKKRFAEAKVAAGAINEISPGDPAAIRILDACRRSV